MLTLEPGASTFPGFGFCLTTFPVFAVAPSSFLTLPILQSAFFSFFLEALSFLPVRLGTTQAVVLKLVGLVALPAIVVTETGTVDGLLVAGAIAVIWPSELTV
jgi:hypothetical protein